MTAQRAKTMHAWVVTWPGPIETGPLSYQTKPVPSPAPGELLVHVLPCGVCRTDLHVSEGDLPVHRQQVTPVAMRALDRGGVLSVAGIHLTDTPPLNYEHELFYEKELRSVTSNTRSDGREFLLRAARYHVRPTIHTYPMAQAQQALADLKAGRFDGAAVLVNDSAAAQ